MILVDANLLLYAKLSGYPQHEAAHAWLEDELNGAHRVGLPWQSLTAFVRIATNPRLFSAPLSSATACDQVREWLELPNVWAPVPTDRHADLFDSLVRDSVATGNLVSDAHLAALALEHGLILCTTDGDFARFRGLRQRNPIA